MAYIEYTKPEKEERPASVERIEVRPWRLGGKKHQMFAIGSGANFNATTNLWLEIIYSVGGVQFFYTRDFLHFWDDMDPESMSDGLEAFRLGKEDKYGFVGMLPETSVFLERIKYTSPDENDQEVTGEIYNFEITADVGAVVGLASPGMRMIKIRLEIVSLETGLQFMQDLNREIIEVYNGKHPDPADLPAGVSDWPFIRQLNQKAYDLISEDYQEEYFLNPLLTGMFDSWLNELPAGGHVLDAGCGHGQRDKKRSGI